MMSVAHICCLILLTRVRAESSDWKLASARCDSRGPFVDTSDFACAVKFGELDKDSDATARFQDSIQTTGWAKLHVYGRNETRSREDRLRVAFAAGFVESALTVERARQHISAYYKSTFSSTEPQSSTSYKLAVSFLMNNDRFVRQKIRSLASSDEYWAALEIVYAQLDGLVAGSRAFCGKASRCLTLLDYLFFQAEQDLSNIIHKPFAAEEWTHDSAAEFSRKSTHCSSIVRVAPGNRDIYMGHNTWTGYYSMLRVLKEYDLPLGGSARKVVFSGYFGQLYSGDDFYLLSSGLTVQETTNALYNDTTAALIQPNCVLSWARTIIANRQASTGKLWAEWFSPYNSGTINNQWQIAAMHLFKPGHSIPDGFFTVLEQMPGSIVWSDESEILRKQGWWVSFNSPYFTEIRKVSGADDMERRFGDAYSYTQNPRARIFARDIPKAENLSAAKRLLRYNNWKHDPLSARGYQGPTEPNAPENAIAARYDLHPWAKVREASGNTDGKMCAWADCLALKFEAVSGPTADQQPPFAWRGQWASSSHDGQPEVFNFTWIDFESSAIGGTFEAAAVGFVI